jgi:hypothetical protein
MTPTSTNAVHAASRWTRLQKSSPRRTPAHVSALIVSRNSAAATTERQMFVA